MRDGFGTFRRAAAGEAEQVFDLIRQRIAWMDERGIQQWNHPGYLRRYPLDYFRQCAEEGQLYALWTECGALAAGAVVLEEDPRWAGYGGKALYVHNLAASLHFSGAGTELLRRCWPWPRSGGRTISAWTAPGTTRFCMIIMNVLASDLWRLWRTRGISGISFSTPWGPGTERDGGTGRIRKKV